MTDKAHEARIQKLEEQQAHTQAAAAGLGGASVQRGSATLVAGTALLIPAVITATSRIIVSIKTMTPGAGNLTVEYAALGANRIVGAPGTFNITALLAAGTINVLDTSVVDWVVVN